MKIKTTGLLTAMLALAFLLGGCASQQPIQPMAQFEVQPLVKEMWKQKVDTLVVVLDASSSMGQDYQGMDKFSIGRDIVAHFNETMPELEIQVALRSFGHSMRYSFASTVPVYGMTTYSRQGLADGLMSIIPAGGPSPMASAFTAANDDLKASQGKIAMVVVTDGKDMGKETMPAAKALAAAYGDRLCIHTVLVGDDETGRNLLKNISDTSGCGLAITADELVTGPAMADFVAAVLLEKADSWIFNDIKFESDKAVLIPSSIPTLEKIVEILKNQPNLAVEIQGHTDSTASAAHNIDLSKRRATTVMRYLRAHGIDARRLTAKGYGEGQPIDTNETEQGKANNRRVELKPLR